MTVPSVMAKAVYQMDKIQESVNLAQCVRERKNMLFVGKIKGLFERVPKGVRYSKDKRYLLVDWKLRIREEHKELWEWIGHKVDTTGIGVAINCSEE